MILGILEKLLKDRRPFFDLRVLHASHGGGGRGSGGCDVTPLPPKKNKKRQHGRHAGDKSRAFGHQKTVKN